jgi:hypothetical protein
MIRRNSDEVVEFSRLLGTAITLLSAFIAKRPRYDEASPYHAAYGLMTKGANSLGAGFELVLSGYLWEPPALFRTGVETYSVAWDIVHSQDRFTAWRNDRKFRSTDSISNAKEVSAAIGKLYGLQSRMNIHTSQINSSPAMFLTDEPKFQLFGLLQPGQEVDRESEIYYALFVTYICLQLAELTFHSFGEQFETIEMVPGEGLARTRVSDTHQRFVDQFLRVAQQMASGDS